jgi:threonine/homoserine/homoserine lactone efflux protein
VAVLSGEALLLLALLTITPGPDTFLTLRQSLTGGLRRAVPTIAGITTGVPVHGAVAGFGLAAVLERSPATFRAVQVAGVLYLVFLAVRSLVAASRPLPPVAMQAPVGREGWAAYRDGLATNLLNPKVALFFLGFLPQFIPPGPAFAWTAVLYAFCHALMGQVQLGVVAVLADRVRDRITGPVFRRSTEAVAGAAFLLFALRLAVDSV